MTGQTRRPELNGCARRPRTPFGRRMQSPSAAVEALLAAIGGFSWSRPADGVPNAVNLFEHWF